MSAIVDRGNNSEFGHVTVEERSIEQRSAQPGSVERPLSRMSMPGALLRLEGLAVVIVALTLYAVLGYRWWVLALLVLAPDLSMIGYLFGPRVGAISYNVVHAYIPPLALGMAGFLFGWPLALQLALIWIVHIGIDRMVGYGLKYSDDFKHTHLQAVNLSIIQ